MNRDHWLEQLFAAIDRKDTEAFVDFLAQDAEFRFGAAAPVRGRAQVAEAVDQFFASIAALSHRLDKVFDAGDSLAVEGEVTYTRHDRTEVTLPFINAFDLDGERIAGYRIYVDIGPLFSP